MSCWWRWRSCPVLFGLVLAAAARRHAGDRDHALGVFWIGVALAHAMLLRELPHGDGIIVDVLVGTFLGDTGAYLGGRLFGPRRSRLASRRTRPSRGW